jgi:hypothetical protein
VPTLHVAVALVMYAEVAGSLQKPKSQVPVGPVMLGFFLFVVVGSGEVCESTQRFCIDPICTARTCCSAARQFPPSSPAARCVHGHIQDASSKVQQLTQHPVCVFAAQLSCRSSAPPPLASPLSK